MLYLIYLFLLLKQVCMCEQCIDLDLMSLVSNPFGVLWFILLLKSERTFVGGILKLIGKSQLLPKDLVFVWQNLLTSL
jgi:hypothetical protein